MNGIDPTGHLVWDCFDPRKNTKSLWMKRVGGPVACTFWEAWKAGGNMVDGAGARCPGMINCPPASDWRDPEGISGEKRQHARYQPASSHSSSSGGGRGGAPTKVRPHPIKPPKPVIDTNAYNGRNPTPAPSLPPAALNWMAGSTATLAAGTITATFTSQAILDILAVATTGFALEQAPAVTNAPGADPGPGGGTDQDDPRDCRVWGSGWRKYGPLDENNGNRAAGVEACLDSHFIDKANNPGSKPKTGTEEDPLYRPPGYDWAKRYAGHLGAPDPQNWRNACHLLAKQLSGSGERLDNLSTCSRAANANPYSHVQPGFEPNMYTYETKVKEAIDAGHVVHYQVTPKYDGARTVPTGYEMKATVYWKSGGSGQLFHDTVENKIYSLKFGEWYNMGRVQFQGGPAPLPGTS